MIKNPSSTLSLNILSIVWSSSNFFSVSAKRGLKHFIFYSELSWTLGEVACHPQKLRLKEIVFATVNLLKFWDSH